MARMHKERWLMFRTSDCSRWIDKSAASVKDTFALVLNMSRKGNQTWRNRVRMRPLSLG